jgi:sugar fermentation stimulation protein A
MERILNVKELLGDFSQGLFVERQNRFVGLVSVKGKIFKAHISDTGRLKELLIPETPVILANNERGKLDYKLVAVLNDKTWVFLNTSLHSKIAQKIIEKGLLGFIPKEIKREVRWKNSRIDFLVDGKFYIEVKGCNLEKRDTCLFPDAPTARGRKHLEDLIELKEKGFETAVLFLVFRKSFFTTQATGASSPTLRVGPARTTGFPLSVTVSAMSIPPLESLHFIIQNIG